MKRVSVFFISGLLLCTIQMQGQKLRYTGPLPALPVSATALRGSGTYLICLNYDSFDNRYAQTHLQPDTLLRYPWNLNFYNDSSLYFSLSTAAQVYDTLANVSSNFSGPAIAGSTITIDSIFIPLSDSNASGQPDTILLSIFDPAAAAVYGSGINSYLFTEPVWTDTIYTGPQNYFPSTQSFYNVCFYPALTLLPGHTFGIKLDFYGPPSDQLYVLGSYREHCGSTYSQAIWADSNLLAPHNSSYYLNFGTSSGYFDFSTEMPFVTGTPCAFFILQNFLFYPFLSVTSLDTTWGINLLSNAGPSFLIYPNPAAGSFELSLNNPDRDRQSVSISDLSNRLLFTTQLPPACSKIKIETEGWPPGVYFVSLLGSAGIARKPMVLK